MWWLHETLQTKGCTHACLAGWGWGTGQSELCIFHTLQSRFSFLHLQLRPCCTLNILKWHALVCIFAFLFQFLCHHVHPVQWRASKKISSVWLNFIDLHCQITYEATAMDSQPGKSKAEKSLQLQLACYFTLLVVAGYCYFRDELKICFKFDFHNVHVVAEPGDHKTIKTVVLWLLVVLSGFCILFSLEPQWLFPFLRQL